MNPSRILLIVVLAIFAILIGGFTVFLASPELRRTAFTAVVPVYNIYQVMSLRSYMRERDFAGAAARLEAHLDRAQQLSRGRSQFVQGLVEATELVVERARLEKEFRFLLPSLRRLVDLEPDLYLGHLWLARALRNGDPKTALSHVDQAIALSPADDRAYREGIEASLNLDLMGRARTYCDGYRTAQLGGPKPRGYHNMFRGTGLRKFAVELDPLSDTPELVTNHGIELGERRSYEFQFRQPSNGPFLRLHLGILPGTRISIYGLRVETKTGPVELSPNEMTITARTGYVRAGPEALHVTSLGVDDEEIVIRAGSEVFRNVWKLELALRFDRLDITNIPFCRTAKD